MENVVVKLQKLLNHQRSAESIGNIHEAEAFAAKAAVTRMNLPAKPTKK